MIDRATVDRILSAAKIVDVVGEFVTLRKAGVNYKGLCPFHDDRNPSFMVSPAKNICHCFVCGKGGTPVGFLMDHEQMTYPDALRWLARKYSIEIVEKELTDEERRQQGERESLFIVNEWACDYFHQVLKEDSEGVAIGRQYFRSRGIRDDIIEKFRLGYAPQRRDALSSAARQKGYKAEFLVKTGLCFERQPREGVRQGGGEAAQPEGTPAPATPAQLVDRFSGRAIFPWFNVSGKVVAFGGRVLDSRTKGVAVKYVNSPESDIYHKERELYGIFQAKKAIVKEDAVFMVEGYTDVIAMHQAGIENVVANSGTALSMAQIHLLHRFTENITLLYDGDDAGIHAAMRGTDMLLSDGMKVKVLLLPDGDDPDSFARKHSTDELRKYIAEHQTDFITFKSRLTVERTTDPVERSKAIAGIVRSISVIPDNILRSTYTTVFAQRVGMSEQTIIAEINKFIAQDREQKTREQERERQRAAGNTGVPARPSDAGFPGGAGIPISPVDTDIPAIASDGNTSPAVSSGISPTVQTVPQPTGTQSSALTPEAASLEVELVRELVRHGGDVVFDNVETEDGGKTTVNVAQYIAIDLSNDSLRLSQPLYQQMLDEAVQRSAEGAFNAHNYFTQHANPEVSRLATGLAIDRYQLGGRFAVSKRDGELLQRVTHLIADYRQELIKARLSQLMQQMQQAQSDEERQAIMKDYMDTMQLRGTLAHQLGRELLV